MGAGGGCAPSRVKCGKVNNENDREQVAMWEICLWPRRFKVPTSISLIVVKLAKLWNSIIKNLIALATSINTHPMTQF